jgi:integrase
VERAKVAAYSASIRFGRALGNALGLLDVRIHDLRHSIASVGVTGGLRLPILGALLGRKNAVTSARYAHLSSDPVRAANERREDRQLFSAARLVKPN